ncbi:MAG TPA: hypothetical protein ENK19_04940 [Acidobacteria bacterium]|nr:hypothetical protein [Acidobacteriota bacterium]
MWRDRSVLEAAANLRAGEERAVLATLVAVEGPSVRRPGARLLILSDGRLAGFLSAGCVEHDLAARVDRVLSEDRPETVRYDAATAADPVLGLGLGCGGGMRVLLEPWPPRDGPDPFAVFETVARRRRPAAMATAVAPERLAGARAVVTADGAPEVAAPPELAATLEELARWGLEGSCGLLAAGSVEVFVERTEPPVRLVLQGATPPALALERLAGLLGWETVPVPMEGGDPGHLPAGVVPDRWTVAALLGHDTAAEARLGAMLLTADLPYVGVMGSRSRRRRLAAALRENGVPEPAVARLRMPIGLDLGAESAPEIALAAAGEILAVLRGREGFAPSAAPGPGRDG